MVYSVETRWMVKPLPVTMHMHDESGVHREVVLADDLAKLYPGANKGFQHIASCLSDLRDVAVYFRHVRAERKEGFRHLRSQEPQLYEILPRRHPCSLLNVEHLGNLRVSKSKTLQ